MKELIKRILSKWGCHHRWEVHNDGVKKPTLCPFGHDKPLYVPNVVK